jgi:transposase-like protein
MQIQENQININQNPMMRMEINAQARRAHVRAFESGADTMARYCELHGLTITTFKNWVSRYSDNQKPAFIPININRNNQIEKIDIKKPLQRIEIHRGDIKVILPEINDLETVLNLIKVVMSCN